MYELKKMESYLRGNLLGPGIRLLKKKKNLPGRGLTKVEKHWSRQSARTLPTPQHGAGFHIDITENGTDDTVHHKRKVGSIDKMAIIHRTNVPSLQ